MIKSVLSLLCSIVCVSLFAQPKLENHGDWARIIVNDKPMLIIGGELGNSSASTQEDIRRIFPHLHKLGLNTVLAPISWELLEPQEGEYDFSTLDHIIHEARRNELKVVLLWFGAWKNSMSCYTPEWFKRDNKRFPRVHNKNGVPLEEASSLSANVLEADKKIFCSMMQHIRDVDMNEQTVIMIQVENEIGMITEPRDYSKDATKMYNSQVPKQLTDYLKKNTKRLNNNRLQIKTYKGTWSELFGNDIYAEEIFQAWTYALYVEEMAKAGKAIYNLPMYVNVALNSRNRTPGEYPSAGPLAHLIDVWHCGAPSISVLGLDLYDKGYRDWTGRYHLPNNPLFIPEIRLEDHDAMRALYAFGHHDAMGFCPFSIENYPLTRQSNSDWRNIDISKDDQLNVFSSNSSKLSPLVSSYRLLRQTEPLILKHQGTKDMDAVLLDNDTRETDIKFEDGTVLHISHTYSLGWEPGAKSDKWPEAACIIIRQDKDDYIVIGSGIVITFSKANGKMVGIAKCEQVEYSQEGEMQIVRHLNGDQTHQGRHIRIPFDNYQIQHFRLYEY
ncbi:MAG: DUF5597 domain-containing protein [Prevotella sp.]|nr:DUF5597 domain-containing protein [Candidatus Equicola faecalis]